LSDQDKDVEILALRHQITGLSRSAVERASHPVTNRKGKTGRAQIVGIRCHRQSSLPWGRGRHGVRNGSALPVGGDARISR
jgi:hypothetical protein